MVILNAYVLLGVWFFVLILVGIVGLKGEWRLCDILDLFYR